MLTVCRRVRIYGRVQGVWYRGWTVAQAKELALGGWVRNRTDGSVEAVLSGPEPAVREMIRRCWQGPELARVDRIEETEAALATSGSFEQWPTTSSLAVARICP